MIMLAIAFAALLMVSISCAAFIPDPYATTTPSGIIIDMAVMPTPAGTPAALAGEENN